MGGVRFVVHGKVQGVFFRASTRSEAMRLGLHGHARNLTDGGVEVIARGSDDALRELEQWLWEGPPAAKVTEVIRSDYDGDVREGFWVL
ncbi:acylphosphatase [Dyella sp.]|uniref:acylphosphatase n=1 Tax=Dyella sp. TaxID=1869338 RepID=UPI002FD8B8AE